MIMNIVFIFVIVLSMTDVSPYYGIRVGMKPKTFGRDIINVIDSCVNSLHGITYPDINDTSGKGLLF